MMMYHLIKFSCKRISSSVDILESRISHILIVCALSVTLILETVSQSSCSTLWPMMMHHHTKFGYKRFSSSEDCPEKL